MPGGRARRAVLPRMPFKHGGVRCSTFKSGNSLARLRSFPCLEAAGQSWHVAYTSPNVPVIQAAVSAGRGVSISPEIAILSDHRVLKSMDGFPGIANTELALVAAADASPSSRRLAEVLAESRSTVQSREAARTKSGTRPVRSVSTAV
jgi:DNA-binding transcriptional LysR family regulator